MLGDVHSDWTDCQRCLESPALDGVLENGVVSLLLAQFLAPPRPPRFRLVLETRLPAIGHSPLGLLPAYVLLAKRWTASTATPKKKIMVIAAASKYGIKRVKTPTLRLQEVRTLDRQS